MQKISCAFEHKRPSGELGGCCFKQQNKLRRVTVRNEARQEECLMSKIDLNGHWKFSYADDDELQKDNRTIVCWEDIVARDFPQLEAIVPGNVELDLERAGIIEDPFFDQNTIAMHKWETYHYWYATEFDVPKSSGQSELVFEGLDTLATVYLDGYEIAQTDNMLIEHKIPLNDLAVGHHELLVHIRPVIPEAGKFQTSPGEGAFTYNYDSLHIRKAPHMYGWDITPRLISGGLWRGVYLKEVPAQRVDRIYFYTKSIAEDASSATLGLYYNVTTDKADIRRYRLQIEASCGEQNLFWEKKLWSSCGFFSLTVNDPQLWWIRDKGTPALYNATVSLLCDGQVVASQTTRFGIRTIELQYKHLDINGENGEFCFLLNGEKTFIRGTNWVPMDAVHARDAQKIRPALELVDDLHCNMIRCWGGNVYEDHEFFDICDEKGILVWQDFSMACAIYPQDEDFCRKIQKEVTSVVRKLRQHPSLALWAGDNECDMGTHKGWYNGGAKGAQNPNDNVLTRKTIPDVLRVEDPWRPYLPSSPYIDEFVFDNKFDYTVEDHLWGPRDYYKGEFYSTAKAMFASECGYHGCVSPESAAKFISQEALWPPQNNDSWLVHAASPEIDYDACWAYRIPLMCEQVVTLFGEMPDNLADFAAASQLSQAEAVKFFIERFRKAKWDRTGIIWWNVIDGWPQFSDAVVDYYYTRKQAYFHIKQCQQPFCLMIDEAKKDGTRDMFAVNDTNAAVSFAYTVRDVESNRIVKSGSGAVGSNASRVVDTLAADPAAQGMYYVEWIVGDSKGYNHYLYGEPTYSLKQCLQWFKAAGLWKAEGFDNVDLLR